MAKLPVAKVGYLKNKETDFSQLSKGYLPTTECYTIYMVV